MIKVPPPQSTSCQPPIQRADWNDISTLTQRMLEVSEELARMSEDIADARTVREFSSDRRKRSLAMAVREFLVSDSATAAETKGRASVAYGEAIARQAEDLILAEQTIAKFEAKLTLWKSLQSALSALRTVAGNV